ncbi:MAG: DNA-binding protein WhiA [Lachnospiraceae bacterium]|nr:DNA-binding protein WhiA [Lachnospiraceae bacterium]
MSFSSEVKEELSKQISQTRHCQIAETAVIVQYCGNVIWKSEESPKLTVRTENAAVARKYFTLLKKTFNINTDVVETIINGTAGAKIYTVHVNKSDDVIRILQAIKLFREDGVMLTPASVLNPILLKNACCRRAVIRGAFLAIGSMSDPNKGYHYELVCSTPMQAQQLKDIMVGFEVDAKIVIRKKYHVVYVKEGAGIVELLNIMEAHVSLMKLENLRIIKEMRNTINRRVNCEAANITKTVNAASKQIEDILYIKDTVGFGQLHPNLREIAEIRLEYPDATLKELGQLLEPSVGKSGVNHRLRKISEFADSLKR